MAAEAAESLLKECKSIIEKYQAKSMFFFYVYEIVTLVSFVFIYYS